LDDSLAMPTLTANAPFESDKTTYLHDRAARPGAPAKSLKDAALALAPLLTMAAFAIGAQALAFTTRAAWAGNRDWVVPVTTVFWVLGAVALAAIVWRRKWQFGAAALALLGVGLVLTILNIVRAQNVDGSDQLRDFYAIASAVMYGCATVAAAVGWALMEIRQPIIAPPPEV
jgi:hypothetical protein